MHQSTYYSIINEIQKVSNIFFVSFPGKLLYTLEQPFLNFSNLVNSSDDEIYKNISLLFRVLFYNIIFLAFDAVLLFHFRL